MKANWPIAVPYLDDEDLPYDYSSLALEQLMEQSVGKPITFERVADQMIKKSGMQWDSPNKDNARRPLHSIIERTLVDPLRDFGGLQKGYVPHEILGEEFQQLSTFPITPF